MPRSVAVPEKTIEHWSSQYIAFRYSTKAALWWPATGQDIDFRCLPNRAGKAVQLELKTVTTTGAYRYEVHVDLGQLWEYRQRPLGHQPFYAFPWPQPGWNGDLHAVAAAARKPATELAFARRGQGLWFGRWMVVSTAAEVANALSADLTAHGSRTRGKVVPLLQFDHGHATWRGGYVPEAVTWLKFWDVLERCGRAGWPQLIRLPKSLISDEARYEPGQVLAFLTRTADQVAADEGASGQFVTLEPGRDGTYRAAGSASDEPGEADQDDTSQDGTDANARSAEPDDHRLVAFLGADAIQGTVGPAGLPGSQGRATAATSAKRRSYVQGLLGPV